MQKISTICSVLNSEDKITILIKSFLKQNYQNKELIIVDGGSRDKTISIIRKFKIKKIKLFLLKKSSIYEAINLGIRKSKGNIINIMGDDDYFATKNIYSLVNINMKSDISYLYGDTEYVNSSKKTIRHYSSKNFNKKKIFFGFMPSHTSLFLRKEIYRKLNYYNTHYKIASDFNLFFNLLNIKSIKCKYLPITISKMSIGGISNRSLNSIIISNIESFNILKKNKVNFPLLRIFFKLTSKFVLFTIFKIKNFLT
jgi:glycosyltransferase involved in cell wall biosynthesis